MLRANDWSAVKRRSRLCPFAVRAAGRRRGDGGFLLSSKTGNEHPSHKHTTGLGWMDTRKRGFPIRTCAQFHLLKLGLTQRRFSRVV
jgi:hypothetical protein